MQDSKVQISPDTWVYIDEDRAKIVVEIDLPKDGDTGPSFDGPARIPAALLMKSGAC